MKSIKARLNDPINRFVCRMNQHVLLTNILFIISTSALILLSASGSNIQMFLEAGLLSILLMGVMFKFDFLRYVKRGISYRKVLISILLAAFICYAFMMDFYRIYFDTIVHGGDSPAAVKTLYDLIPVGDDIKNKIINGAVAFAGMISLFTMSALVILAINIRTYFNKSECWQDNHGYIESDGRTGIKGSRIISFILLLLMIIIMVAYGSSQSFWTDELKWSIGKVSGNNFIGICKQLLADGYNMPLYYWILAIVYKYMPYGEVYLLIPSFLFVIAGIIFLSLTAKKLHGASLSFITLCLCTISSVLMTQGGWELRPYAIFFCLSALTLLSYVCRMQQEIGRNIVFYGLAMILLLYSHWFGAVLLLFYGITDIILFIKKRISLKFIVSYIIAGIAFLPWFILMVLSVSNDLSSYWADIPRLVSILFSIKYLLSGSFLCFCIFALGSLLILLSFCKTIRLKEYDTSVILWMQLLMSVFWVIGITFLYSKLINPNGSIYMNRYFFAVLPHVILITGYGICCLINKAGSMMMEESKKSKRFTAIVMICLFAVVGFSNYSSAIFSVTSISEPYREAAEHLAADSKVYSKDSLVISSTEANTWVEYYFEKRGFKVPNNVAAGSSSISIFVKEQQHIESTPIFNEDILEYNNIFLFEEHTEFSDSFIKFIEDNYTQAQSYPELDLTVYSK